MKTTLRKPTISDAVLLVALAAIWGASFMFIKIAVEEIPPLTIAAARITLAASLLAALSKIRGLRFPTDWATWQLFFAIGLIGNVLPFFLIAWGETSIDSGIAALLMAGVPLSTLLLAQLMTHDEKFTAAKAVGVGLGFVGIVILVGPDVLARIGGSLEDSLEGSLEGSLGGGLPNGQQIDPLLGQGAVLLGAICYATAGLMTRKTHGISPDLASAGVMICAAVQIIPASLVFDKPWALSPGPLAIASIAALGILATALASVILFHLINRTGAIFVSLNNYMVPVFGIFWGAAILGETVGWQAIVALALILIGIDLGQGRVLLRLPPYSRK